MLTGIPYTCGTLLILPTSDPLLNSIHAAAPWANAFSAVTTVIQASIAKMSPHSVLFRLAILSLLSLATANLVTHDDTLQPDITLRAASEVIARDCQSRQSVVINGTSPGPELRIKGGKTTWIRVYNDMTDQNLTMVGTDAENPHLHC